MMRPRVSLGGVLPDSDTNEQHRLHDTIRGVGYTTAGQQQARVNAIVKPFTSIQIQKAKQFMIPETYSKFHQKKQSSQPTPEVSNDHENGQVVKTTHLRGTGSHKKTNSAVPPQPASVRPASHKKSSSSISSAASAQPRPSTAQPSRATSHKKSHSTSSATSTSSVDYLRDAPLVSSNMPAWLVSSVHPPDRPNAPSQTGKVALHHVEKAEKAAAAAEKARAEGKEPEKPRPSSAKSHKLLVQPYGKQFTSANSDQMNEKNAEIVIERHARPLVIHPKDRKEPAVVKFVPINHVVGVRPLPLQEKDGNKLMEDYVQSATPGNISERYLQFTEAQPIPPPEQQPSLSSRARESFQQMQAEFKPHGLFSQVDQKRKMELEEEKYQTAQQPDQHQRTASSGSSGLTTPQVDINLPQPYSSAFPKPPSPKVPSPSQHQSQSVSSSSTLASPSPVRNHFPQPTAQQLQEAETQTTPPPPSVTLNTNISTSSSSTEPPLSPSLARHHAAVQAEQDRKKLETEHEKQMKAYLSPASRKRRAATKDAEATPHKAASPLFTPNPYAKTADEEDEKKDSGLFYNPVTVRPPDLPRADPRIGLPIQTTMSLYPATDSDPFRSLAASLRGPRLKYSPPVPAVSSDPDDITSPLTSPSRVGSSVLKQGDSEPTESWLQREIDEHARAKAQLQEEERAKWRAKWDRVKETKKQVAQQVWQTPRTEARARAAMLEAVSGSEEHKEPPSSEAKRQLNFDANQQQSRNERPIVTQPSSTASVSSSPQPQHPHSQQAPHHGPSASDPGVTVVKPASSASRVSGGRISDPIIVSHNPTPQHYQTKITNGTNNINRVTFANTPQQQQQQQLSQSSSQSKQPTPPTSSSTSTSAVIPSSSSSSVPPVRRFVVGSTNATKVNAVRAVIDKIFSSAHDESYLTRSGRTVFSPTNQPRTNEVVGISVDSGVSPQPLSSAETKLGALTRAKLALAADPQAEFGIGIEGGIEQVDGTWYESGFVAVVDRAGKVGTGTSARFEIADSIAQELLTGRTELATIVDRLSGLSGVRSKQGFMGLISNNLVQRAECYEQGVIFAFAPFISSPVYW